MGMFLYFLLFNIDFRIIKHSKYSKNEMEWKRKTQWKKFPKSSKLTGKMCVSQDVDKLHGENNS